MKTKKRRARRSPMNEEMKRDEEVGSGVEVQAVGGVQSGGESYSGKSSVVHSSINSATRSRWAVARATRSSSK